MSIYQSLRDRLRELTSPGTSHPIASIAGGEGEPLSGAPRQDLHGVRRVIDRFQGIACPRMRLIQDYLPTARYRPPRLEGSPMVLLSLDEVRFDAGLRVGIRIDPPRRIAELFSEHWISSERLEMSRESRLSVRIEDFDDEQVASFVERRILQWVESMVLLCGSGRVPTPAEGPLPPV